MEKISYSKSLNSEVIYIDTRSPGEFNTDHIPGAVNVPIFNNEERSIVGTLYTRVGHDEAYSEGREIFEKKINEIQNQLLKYKDKRLIIYCWRGGMRSKTIVELAMNLGIDSMQLTGGYKTYRKHVREHLASYKLRQKVIVLYGLTGTGKTDLLNLFIDSIDLEGLAQHRSSVYGAIGLEPKSQKMFESQLLHELNNLVGKYVVIEGESRKIGNVIVPEFLFNAMSKGIGVEVIADMKNRVDRLIAIYAEPKSIVELRKITESLKQRLGKKLMLYLIECLDENKLGEFMQKLLENYYDPLYTHTNKDRIYSLCVDMNNQHIAAKQIADKYNVKFK